MLPAGPEESVGFSAGKDECTVVLGTESDSGNEPASEVDGANDQIQLLPGNLYKILEGPFVIILKSFFTDDQGTIGGDLMESIAHGHELRGGIQRLNNLFPGSAVCFLHLLSPFHCRSIRAGRIIFSYSIVTRLERKNTGIRQICFRFSGLTKEKHPRS